MRTTKHINIMIKRIKRKSPLLLLVLGLIFINEVKPSIFIVYPLGIGQPSSILPTLKLRKLDNDSRNTTGLHLVYPLKEELIIMTPTPMEEYQENATTTNVPTDDNNEFLTTTTIPDATNDYWQNDIIRTDLSTTTISAEDTTILDVDSITQPTTKKVPLLISPSESISQSLSIIGPLKIVRKRKFTSKQYSEPISTIMTPSTTTNRTYVRRNKKMSKYTTGEINKPLLLKVLKMNKTFSTTKEPKRYTYKRRTKTIKPATESKFSDAAV